MRWDCEKQGCFNKLRRPKIEELAECLPGKIAFSDVDGVVEINGYGLFLEWKSFEGNIPIGQRIMYERFTKTGQFTAFVINGDAETMIVESMAIYWKGRFKGWQEADLDALKEHIKRWSQWAQGQGDFYKKHSLARVP